MDDERKSPQLRTDKSLLFDVQDGHEAAADELFRRHAPRLMAVARKRLSAMLNSRLDPDDIVQSTFKSFFTKASHGGYDAPESGDLFKLLIVIAMRKVNAKAEYHQAGKRDVRRCAGDKPLDARPGNDEASLRELYLTIEDICADMAEGQRQIIELRLEGRSVAEIAEACQRSKRTVERELQGFRNTLGRYFEP